MRGSALAAAIPPIGARPILRRSAPYQAFRSTASEVGTDDETPDYRSVSKGIVQPQGALPKVPDGFSVSFFELRAAIRNSRMANRAPRQPSANELNGSRWRLGRTEPANGG
jgi:hypothetical protein